MACYKSLLSRCSVLIKYTMRSSNLFSPFKCFWLFLWSTFFRVQVFRIQVFLGPGFSGFRFLWVQVFQDPGPGSTSRGLGRFRRSLKHVHNFSESKMLRSSHWRCSVKKDVLQNFAIFTEMEFY